MKISTSLIGLLVLVAGPAASQCLDASVLSRGLTVQYDNGDFTNIRRTSGGYQQVDEHYVNGDPMFRFRAHRGLYFVEEFEPDGFGRPVAGSGLIIEFEVDPASLPDPLPGTSWRGNTVNIFDDGTRRDEQMSVVFEAADPLRVPGCDYQVVRANVRYDWGVEGGLNLQYAYLPQIGTAILISSQFDDDEFFSYMPVALQPLTK